MLIALCRKRFLLVFSSILFAMVCLQFSAPANVEAWMPGIPHPIQGEILNSDGPVPVDDEIIFQAYVIGREGETQTELGPSTNFCVDGFYGLDAGNFYSSWASGDMVKLDVTNLTTGEGSHRRINLGPESPGDDFPNYVMREAFLCLPGDINDGGSINTGDAILALRKAVGLDMFDIPELCRGDVNCDGLNNTGDAILILRYAVGLITEFPCNP